MSTAKTILIAAGGTGGHLFPARALAEELGRRGVTVDLVTDTRGGVFDEGFPARDVHQVPAATPVGRSPLRALGAGWTLFRGVLAARRLIGRIKPDAVIGFGGYPTLPPLIAGRLMGVRLAVHDQNAVFGRANRLLAYIVDAVATSVPEPAKANAAIRAKSVMTGNPVRDAVIAASKTPYDPPLADGTFRLLVFGGSQGAHVFSELIPAALATLPTDHRARLRLTMQCRDEDLSATDAALSKLGVEAETAPFFVDLPARIADAHLVVARSGASTVSEVAAIGRPAILIPLPHAIDNDQRENARMLESAGGAWMRDQRKLDARSLARDIEQLMSAPDRLVTAAAAARASGRPEAVSALAGLVLDLAGR